MKLSSTVGVALWGALTFASAAIAQQPAPRAAGSPAGDKVGVAISLQAGGGSYTFTGQATCTHEPKGYIYMVPAQQWSVSQSDGSRSVMLTFWRPAAGGRDMFSLYLSTGGKHHRIDTVKTKNGGDPQGSGEVAFTPVGSGGAFTVKATAANGVAVTGTIKCAGFRAPVVEGGN